MRAARLRFIVGTAIVTTLSLVATATASTAPPAGDNGAVNQAAAEFVTPLHESPPGCTMDAYLQVTALRFRRGDNNAIIADYPADPLPVDFSPGDTVEVRTMEIDNQGCDIEGADLIVAVYKDGSGAPGSSVDSAVVAFGQNIGNGANPTYNPNWVYTTNGVTDVDVGDDLPIGGDPEGDQMGILGIIDAGYDPGAALFDTNECGLSGFIHNGKLEGTGCSVSVVTFSLFHPEITVKKRAFSWNGNTPEVFLQQGAVVVNGKFLKDGKSWLQPNKTVHYLYEVTNVSPITGLVPVSAVDNTCSPLGPVMSGNAILGDDGNDGLLDPGETWFYLCSQKVTLPQGEDFTVVHNTATFVFEDRNGNEASDADDFELNVGFSCKGKPYTILGTNGPDVIVGTPAQDVIVARGGDDTISGMGGNDIICAGNGDDVVNGNDDKDKIFGQGGDDHLMGDAHQDRLKGGGGDDLLEGGTHPDFLKGGAGTDVADGGPGVDTCDAETELSC